MTFIKTATICLIGFLFISGCTSPQGHMANPLVGIASIAHYGVLKSLTGDWYLVGGERLGKKVEPNLKEPFMSYAVNSGGHAVVAKVFGGSPNEMISIYYLDMGRLKMDHYCSLGNQPRMVSVPSAGNLGLTFEVVGISNMPEKNDLHISSHKLEFNGADELTVYWGATKNQQPSSGSVYNVKRNRLR
jgi:hypothetical protein